VEAVEAGGSSSTTDQSRTTPDLDIALDVVVALRVAALDFDGVTRIRHSRTPWARRISNDHALDRTWIRRPVAARRHAGARPATRDPDGVDSTF
jgi:hypothetical protein